MILILFVFLSPKKMNTNLSCSDGGLYSGCKLENCNKAYLKCFGFFFRGDLEENSIEDYRCFGVPYSLQGVCTKIKGTLIG